MSSLLKELIEQKMIKDLSEIEAVGHRIVHGGNKYSRSVVIDDRVLQEIESISDLAPLHNPANLMGVKAFQKLFQQLYKLLALIQRSIKQ